MKSLGSLVKTARLQGSGVQRFKGMDAGEEISLKGQPQGSFNDYGL